MAKRKKSDILKYWPESRASWKFLDTADTAILEAILATKELIQWRPSITLEALHFQLHAQVIYLCSVCNTHCYICDNTNQWK